MLQIKTKLSEKLDSTTAVTSIVSPNSVNEPTNSIGLSAQRSVNSRPSPPRKASRPTLPPPRVADSRDIQTRVPALIGEATFRGMVAVDGIIFGQPAANGGGSLSIRQRGRSSLRTEAELDGELRFIDTIRISRRVAGTIYSEKGTLIVDTAAVIDANVEVGIALIGGTVKGDIVAHQRVELGPTAKIYGNIWTRSLSIQNGAIFEGICQMLETAGNGN